MRVVERERDGPATDQKRNREGAESGDGTGRDLKQTYGDIPRHLRRRHAGVRPEMTAADIAEWDSFNHINLIVATEAKFGIKFQTSEIESLRNVGHFVELIEKKLAAGATTTQKR